MNCCWEEARKLCGAVLGDVPTWKWLALCVLFVCYRVDADLEPNRMYQKGNASEYDKDNGIKNASERPLDSKLIFP